MKPFHLVQKEAIEYIQQELSLGWSFSQKLLWELDFSKGDVITFLPSFLSESDILNLRISVFKTAQMNFREDIENFIAKRVYTYLANIPNSFFITETLMSKEPVPPKRPLRNYFLHAARIYLFADKSGNTDEIKSVLIRSRDYPLITCLTSLLDTKLLLRPGDTVSDQLLQELAKRTEALIIGAYDAEAFIIWRKTHSVISDYHIKGESN